MKPQVHTGERGVTLMELVVGIVVISVAGAALSGTLAYLNGSGNTSILQAQAQSIANAYLSEITAKRFVADGREGSRDQYDDISDYNGLVDAVATDEFGTVAGNFRVSVNVVPAALNGIPAAAMRRIDVTVDYGATFSVVATGYRSNRP